MSLGSVRLMANALIDLLNIMHIYYEESRTLSFKSCAALVNNVAGHDSMFIRALDAFREI
jgi:hypothetical protein